MTLGEPAGPQKSAGATAKTLLPAQACQGPARLLCQPPAANLLCLVPYLAGHGSPRPAHSASVTQGPARKRATSSRGTSPVWPPAHRRPPSCLPCGTALPALSPALQSTHRPPSQSPLTAECRCRHATSPPTRVSSPEKGWWEFGGWRAGGHVSHRPPLWCCQWPQPVPCPALTAAGSCLIHSACAHAALSLRQFPDTVVVLPFSAPRPRPLAQHWECTVGL